MARKFYNEPQIIQNHNNTVGIRFQTLIKRVALAAAIVIGIVALYFCLMPALAVGTTTYVYFDNSLSKYDTVYYSLNGGNYVEMKKLSDVPAAVPASRTGDNHDVIYVTSEEIAVDSQVRFRGVASGTVYDTVTNYRVNAASREWGYDYNEFTWTTPDTLTVSNDTNCYFAPTLCMEYKYSGYASEIKKENYDPTVYTIPVDDYGLGYCHFIWSHGDSYTKDGIRYTAKPEDDDYPTANDYESNNQDLSDSFIDPNTNGNRNFYYAQYEMIGKWGHVDQKNDLGDLSQSGDGNTTGDTYEGSVDLNGDGTSGLEGNTVYHASADFFDYYSDWELSGMTLEDHTITYSYSDATASALSLFSETYNRTLTEKIKYTFTYGLKENENFVIASSLAKGGDNGPDRTTDTENGSMKLDTANDNDSDYIYLTLPTTLSQGSLHNVDMWLKDRNAKNGNVQLVMYYKIGDVEYSDVIAEILLPNDGTEGTWVNLNADFVIPQNAAGVQFRLYDTFHRDYYLDDFVITEVSGYDMANSFSWNLSPTTVTNFNIDGSKFSHPHFSNKELYDVVFDILPSAEDTIQLVMGYTTIDGQYVEVVMNEVGVSPGKWSSIRFDSIEHDIQYTSAVMYIKSKNGSTFRYDNFDFMIDYFTEDVTGSFSEGTNRISYAYQGLTWNYAISDYYYGETAEPLYFGSNSWMTGNGRYDLADRHGNPLFTTDEVSAAYALAADKASMAENSNYFITYEGILNDKSQAAVAPDRFGAYLFPFERQYFKNLYGFNMNAVQTITSMNTPLGQSNSRGVPGLVELIPGATDEEEGSLQLKGSGIDSPYFNSEFIEGDNNTNTVYGNHYGDVDFDFVYDEATGYFEYDSTRAKYATRLSYNKDTGYYMDYYNYEAIAGGDTAAMGVKKADVSLDDENGSSQTVYQFYPFNSPLSNDRFATENLMFGMNLQIDFNMYRENEKRNKSIFKFSGDDDVWVYVDDKLALDIGGTHTAVGGVIDLQTGYGVVGSTFDENTGVVEYSADAIDWTKFVDGGKATEQGVSDVEKAAFAIGTNTGIKNRTDEPFTSAAFFDDTFEVAEGTEGKYTTIVDEANGLYKVSYSYTDTSGTAQTGAAVFKLNKVVMTTNPDADTDLENHKLNIYYMERGLNSSNFKLAFNFVPHTEREVTKVWADEDTVDHSNDSVKVELYRTVPEIKDIEVTKEVVDKVTTYQADSKWPENLMYVRIQGYNPTSGIYQKNGRFVTEGTALDNTMYYNAMTVDTKVYLTLNGINLSWASYSDLIADEKLNLQIGLNKDSIFTELTEENFGSDDLGSYIIVPAGTQIRIPTLNAVTETSFAETAADNEWRIDTANGWLIDARAYDNNGTPVQITAKVQGSVGTDTYTDADTGRIYSDKQDSETVDYIPMNFLVVKRARYYSANAETGNLAYMAYNYDVLTTPYDENIQITSSVKNISEDRQLESNQFRYVGTREAAFNGVSTDLSGALQCNNIGYGYWKADSTMYNWLESAAEATVGSEWSYNINNIHQDTLLELYVSGSAEDFSASDFVKWAAMNGLTFTRTYNYDVTTYKTITEILKDQVVYSDPVLIDPVIELNDSNDWYHMWDDILEAVEFDENTKYEYKYFIREVEVNSDHANSGGKYKTVYYELDEQGEIVRAIEPQLVTPEGETEPIELYSIDCTSGAIQISNEPVVDLNMTKQWAATKDGEEKDVIIDIYNNLGERVHTSYLSSGSEWKASALNLPLYKNGTKLTYYGVERTLSGFIPSYNTPSTTITVEGTEITVYPFGTNGTLQVSNCPDNSGLFKLNLLKVSASDTSEKVKGAKFKLEISDDGTNYTVLHKELTTDEDGSISVDALNAVGKYYRLTETVSPLGFKLCESPIVFYVTADEYKDLSFNEQTNIVQKDSALYVSSSWTDKTDTLDVTLKNDVQAIVLPNTGGSGTKPLIIGGSVLGAMFVIGFALRKKRSA